MRALHLHIDSAQRENLLIGAGGGFIAFYEGLGWLLPHFGLLSLPATLGLCLGASIALGLHMAARQ